MKLENYQRVTELVKEIEELNRVIEQLNGKTVAVLIHSSGFQVLHVGTWDTSTGELKKDAQTFLGVVKDHYTYRLNILLAELETL